MKVSLDWSVNSAKDHQPPKNEKLLGRTVGRGLIVGNISNAGQCNVEGIEWNGRDAVLREHLVMGYQNSRLSKCPSRRNFDILTKLRTAEST